MKKKIVVRVVTCMVMGFVILLSSSVTYSASVEMPNTEKGKVALKLGVNSFKRKIKYDSGEIARTVTTGKVESDQYFIRGKYGISDRLEIYADYGSADMYFDYDNTIYDNEYDRDSFWGAGLAGEIFRTENGFKVGFDVHYAEGNADLKELKGYAGTTTTIDSFTGDIKWEEWHAALFVAKQFKFLEPFAGVKYSDYRHNQKAGIVMTVPAGGTMVTEDLDYKSEDNIGIFVGTKLNFKESFSFTVQGRFLDEEGIGCSLGYRF